MISRNARFRLGGMLILVASFSATLSGCHHARRGDALAIAKTASFSDPAAIPPAVRSECQLETKLPEILGKSARRRFDPVVLIDDVSSENRGRVLSVKILHVLGAGGGVYSGPKTITIAGVLRDNGEVVGSFTAGAEHFPVGPFGPGVIHGGGTCGMLYKASERLTFLVMRWLEMPTMDAKLGHAILGNFK